MGGSVMFPPLLTMTQHQNTEDRVRMDISDLKRLVTRPQPNLSLARVVVQRLAKDLKYLDTHITIDSVTMPRGAETNDERTARILDEAQDRIDNTPNVFTDNDLPDGP